MQTGFGSIGVEDESTGPTTHHGKLLSHECSPLERSSFAISSRDPRGWLIIAQAGHEDVTIAFSLDSTFLAQKQRSDQRKRRERGAYQLAWFDAAWCRREAGRVRSGDSGGHFDD